VPPIFYSDTVSNLDPSDQQSAKKKWGILRRARVVEISEAIKYLAPETTRRTAGVRHCIVQKAGQRYFARDEVASCNLIPGLINR